MRAIKNMFYVIVGYFKFIFIKIFNYKRFNFGKIPRVSLNSKIAVSNNSKMDIGDKFKCENNTTVVSLNNGYIEIGNNVALSCGNRIISHQNITIGDNTIMGPNVFIYDHDHVFSADTGVERKKYKTSPVKIGKNCWIGANTVILRGTTIGDNCLVGAGCVLKGNYPSNCKIIQKRDEKILTEER